MVLVALAAGIVTGWRRVPRSEPLIATGEVALTQAATYSARLDSSPDPAPLARGRDACYDAAQRAFEQAVRRGVERPAAELGLARLTWRRQHDLAAATLHASRALDELLAQRRPRSTHDALVAQAYATRAECAVEACQAGAATPALLAAAQADLRAALARDPRPAYEALAASLARLSAQTAPAAAP